MAAQDAANLAISTLEPHQLAAYLQPPTEEQQLSYVVEHCNYILPQLASDSLTASLISSPSSATPTFTTLPSSSSLEAYLAELTSAHQHASARTADLESQLRNQLLSSLSGVKILKQKLASLPDEIASTEDKLLDLCEDLVITAASSSSAAPESSKDGAITLMNRLDQLHTAILQLKKAKDYFGILAQAEDFRLAAIKSDTDETQRESALHNLAQLDALVRKVEKLSAVGSEQQHQKQQTDDSEPKLVAFLRAQRSATVKTLRKARCSRLSEAIAQTGWGQGKADVADKQDGGDQLSNTAAKLIESSQVKQAWSDVCQLQDTAEHLGLLKRATAKPSSGDDESEDHPPGSDDYQPLLTTQCLIEPMLLRFRYHFDGDRSTNRLDKPEWYMSHIASLIRTQAPLFAPAKHGIPGSGEAVVRLNRAYANAQSPGSSSRKFYRHIDTYAELLHGLLIPLRRKLASTMPSLLDHPSLLAHTVFQALTFDAEVAETFPPSLTVIGGAGTRKISDDILDNSNWFNRWLDGEKDFALRRFEEIMNSPDAWAIGSSDSLADDDEQVFYSSLSDHAPSAEEEGGQRTTKSARSTIEILDSVSERYRPLPSLSQRLSFLAIVQLPILRSYAQRLTRSLDAFESLSSAFARAMPGEIVPGAGSASLVSGGADSDMVKGLRGLGRLVKALLSAQYVCSELERWSETAAFVEMSESLHSTEEGRALALGLRKDETAEEDRELDAASLGMLLRRGLKRGAAVARPLTSGGGGSPILPSGEAGMGTPKLSDVGQKQVLNEFGRYGVWEEPRRKFGEIATRAITGIERLIVSETLELLRPYILRRWDQEPSSSALEEEEGDKESYPTPTLIPSLSIFSSHLGHLCSILDRETLLPIYRHISSSIANALVDRVVISGGSRRFTYEGGLRFDQDLQQGWLAVVTELVQANSSKGKATAGMFGRVPKASWKPALDAARLLSLSSSTSSGAAKAGQSTVVTLAKAVQIVFDAEDEGVKGSEYTDLMEKLGVDDSKINVKEVLRRRVEVWK
ncbi:uncharacterized protein UTRI_03618 [Ustilago trichophora]|uniref:Uncharacterized protein n=1 Tax=Ustilago trichophora TaxID=86804 RepID=A0A5C3E2P3_9BASI|nr:uncharacterized protein UTRI_03618 [Ustilago trichophora]